MFKKYTLFLVLMFCFLVGFQAKAQQNDVKLAKRYMTNAEYDKAAVLYEDLYDKSRQSFTYYYSLFDCYLLSDRHKEAEKLIKKQSKRYPDSPEPFFDKARLLATQDKPEDAEKVYQKCIDKSYQDLRHLRAMARRFESQEQISYALKLYQKAESHKTSMQNRFKIAEYFGRLGDMEGMTTVYLDLMVYAPKRAKQVKSLLLRSYGENTDNLQILRRQLIQKLQKQKENALVLDELLVWLYWHQGKTEQAVNQEFAIDKKYKLKGKRLLSVAQICSENQAFDLGLDVLSKLTKQGETSPYYRFALEQSLELKTKQLEAFPEEEETLKTSLKTDFEQYFSTYPKSGENITSQYLYAKFTSRFLEDDSAAISTLKQALTFQANSKELAECKLLLGDILLINNKLWESLLYYKQVDLDFEHSVLGHEARFRRAKVSFYQGDFQWAKDQLDILKQSTTKLIANNAMELSLLIQESLNLDSTTLALELYARADLLSFQGRYTEADDLLNGLIKLSSNQLLIDDALLLKANLAERSKHYQKAIEYLSQILNLEEDLLKDNALFQLANLYENQLKDLEKAKTYYQQLLVDYQDSYWTAQARINFRKLNSEPNTTL